jgi:hypothetical protein
VDASRFDHLAKTFVVIGTRRRVLRAAAAVALAAPFAGGGAVDARGRCPKGTPLLNNKGCPRREAKCRGGPSCYCSRTTEGRRKCLNHSPVPETCPETPECTKSIDCGPDLYCAQLRGCCPVGLRRCLPKCTRTISSSGGAAAPASGEPYQSEPGSTGSEG